MCDNFLILDMILGNSLSDIFALGVIRSFCSSCVPKFFGKKEVDPTPPASGSGGSTSKALARHNLVRHLVLPGLA